jgi:hypothetical protein
MHCMQKQDAVTAGLTGDSLASHPTTLGPSGGCIRMKSDTHYVEFGSGESGWVSIDAPRLRTARFIYLETETRRGPMLELLSLAEAELRIPRSLRWIALATGDVIDPDSCLVGGTAEDRS